MTKTILFEIGTEELPASQIRNISKSLFESLKKKFLENEFLFENNEIFSTPRRIGFIFHNINIETAEKQKIESENKIKEYQTLINNSKNEARNYFNEARKKIIQDIDKKREKIEEEINLEIKNAEKEIVELKKSSPEKINKISTETSAQLIKQLIGEEINNSSISAIVEDLSKKNKGKYYGN